MKKEAYKGDYNKDLLDQYKLYVEMMDKISDRRIKSNYFYTALLSGVFTLLSLIIEFYVEIDILLSNIILNFTSIIGIILCITWFIHIGSYRLLNDAKFKVIHKMEEYLPYECFKKEWKKVKEKKYIKLTFMEQIVPVIFFAFFLTILIITIIT